jgi:hypothetical protein
MNPSASKSCCDKDQCRIAGPYPFSGSLHPVAYRCFADASVMSYLLEDVAIGDLLKDLDFDLLERARHAEALPAGGAHISPVAQKKIVPVGTLLYRAFNSAPSAMRRYPWR